MSSESKKKRGESGVSNAKNIPFRYRGYPKGYSLSTAIGHSDHPRMAGSKLLHAMTLAQSLTGFRASDRMYRAVDATIDHITKSHARSGTAREWADAA